MKKRFIYSNNGTLQNYTEEINNYHSGETALTFVAAEDAIFIGSNLPFNHIYVKMGSTVNANASTMSVSLWDGSDFNAVAELVDGTDCFSQSGFIEFTPDKNESWSMEDTVDASGNGLITGLGDVTIYDKYWLKITVSADLTADLTIGWLGQIFSNDDDLGSEYQELLASDILAAIETGKTDYQEQAVRATGVIIGDLKRKRTLWSANQILERENLMLASVSKVAEIIYGLLGNDYLDDKLEAKKEYGERLGKAFPTVDTNKDGIASPTERAPQFGELFR
jgi:hypothetical protein